jgi:hypothetical protein
MDNMPMDSHQAVAQDSHGEYQNPAPVNNWTCLRFWLSVFGCQW